MTYSTAVKQDLVISCYKPFFNFRQKIYTTQNQRSGHLGFCRRTFWHICPFTWSKKMLLLPLLNVAPKFYFDRLIAFYVQKSLPVPVDAGKFQQGLRERFVARDGMFFTEEQVQEYDKKKAENPEFIQLSILVSSEQDGVLWLKNLLSENKLTYQDIQPQWMQALAGVRKGRCHPRTGRYSGRKLPQKRSWAMVRPRCRKRGRFRKTT